MPNRVIKESIKRSAQIDSLTWFEEVVFYRLLVTADDYGCIDGRMALLKSDLFPLKENVTRRAIEDAISKLVSVGLLEQYTVSGMPYLSFPTWERHQRIRNKRPKYPTPSQKDLTDNCQSNDGRMTAKCPPESESESNPNPNPYFSPEPSAGSAPEAGCGIAITLNTGERYEPTESKVEQWAQLYPAVDVRQQLRNMAGWCDANRAKRKTRGGVERFIAGWLAREQDRGARPKSGGEKPQNQALDYTQRSYTPEQLQGVYMDIMSDENGGGG